MDHVRVRVIEKWKDEMSQNSFLRKLNFNILVHW